MGKVVCGACRGAGSRSRLVGKAMCGLSVKRAGQGKPPLRGFFCFVCGVKREEAGAVG
jgi:hypothetical protein